MADYSSSSRKTKTTKRTDRSSRLAERSSQINLSLIEHNDEKSSTGPYQCVGKFSDDFQNLCRQNQISFIPVVLSRPKRAVTPTPTEVTSKEKLKGGQTGGGVTTRRTTQASNLDSLSMTQSDLLMPGVSSSQKQQSIGTLNEHSEDSNKDADGEPLPKSFILVKDRFEYFKPKIHVEYEHPEKSDAILELYIKGWKIDTKIMNIIQQCLLRSEKLVTLNLWCCGLNEETIDILAGFLPKCSNLKNVSLDGNPTIEENYHKLISSDSIIQSLSLRNCQITDSGAQKLGYALGNIYSQNKKLLILNLSTNYIGDKGAIELANGLRTNRTLLVLNLSSNQIGDIGAKYFAETLSRFKMTHEEIVKRRMLKREQIFKDNPTILRKTKQDTFDRPQSIAQNKTPKESTIGRVSKKENLSNTRDRSKSKDQNNKDSTINEKQSGSKMKSKEKESNPSVLGTSTLKKDKSGRETKMDGSATSDKVAKSVKNKNSKTKLRDSDTENELRSTSGGKISSINQMYTEIDPLMDETEAVEGDLWLSGNRTLIALNLSRNRITSKGVKEFLLCIQYQLSIHLFNKSAFANGLLKLNLNKNAFQSNDENYVKFTELLKTRDPIANKANEEKDTISVISKEGKETSRSKSGKNLMKNLA